MEGETRRKFNTVFKDKVKQEHVPLMGFKGYHKFYNEGGCYLNCNNRYFYRKSPKNDSKEFGALCIRYRGK